MTATPVTDPIVENEQVLAHYAQLWDMLAIQIHGLNETSVVAMHGNFYHHLGDGGRRYMQNRMSRATGSENVYFVRDGMHPDRWLLGNYHEFQAVEGSAIYDIDGIPTLTLNGPIPAFPNIDPGPGAAQFNIESNFAVTSIVSTPETDGIVSDSQTDGKDHASNAASPTQENDADAHRIRIPRPPNAYILYRTEKQADIVKEHPGIRNNEISVLTGSMWNGETREVRAKYAGMAEALKVAHNAAHPNYKYTPRRPGQVKRRAKRTNAQISKKFMGKVMGKVGTQRKILIGNLDNDHIRVLMNEADKATEGYDGNAQVFAAGFTTLGQAPTTQGPADPTLGQTFNLVVSEYNNITMRHDIEEWNSSIPGGMVSPRRPQPSDFLFNGTEFQGPRAMEFIVPE